jgi:drug/metabolite transporter (DMT)-like permease
VPSRPELELFLVAAIWGFDFVAQRQGVLRMGAFWFNAACFGLGTLVTAARMLRREAFRETGALRAGILAGCALFLAISLQTIGMASTGAGKAAFITSLYLVLVPIASRLFGERIPRGVWLGCLLALAGLWLLCGHGGLSFSQGDLLVLASAFFWAAQILVVGHFAPTLKAAPLSFWQFLTCCALSLAAGLLFEDVSLGELRAAFFPILYNGLLSAGVAYSLQVAGQGGTTPSRAAILLSLETFFAAIGGVLLLDERLGAREIFGCLLMLLGTLASQLRR